MDPLREAAETIRAYVVPGSSRCLVPEAEPVEQRYMQATLLEFAQNQLADLDRLLSDPLAEASDLKLPVGLSVAVDANIRSGDRVYDWRQLAAVMVAADHLLQLLREGEASRG